MKLKLAQSLTALVALVFGVMLWGCSSTPVVDWNTRIGTYTFDQTVQELGQPEKSTKLDDGTLVAEWFLRHEVQSGTPMNVPVAGSGLNPDVNPAARNDYLRLTFGPDGRLKQSSTITR